MVPEVVKEVVEKEKSKMLARLKELSGGSKEILSELKKDKHSKAIRIEKQDDKIIANYTGNVDGNYEEFKKIHDSFDKFEVMARKWFGCGSK